MTRETDDRNEAKAESAMSWSRRLEFREYLARWQLEAGMLAEENVS
jgi:hypothetical protein